MKIKIIKIEWLHEPDDVPRFMQHFELGDGNRKICHHFDHPDLVQQDQNHCLFGGCPCFFDALVVSLVNLLAVNE